VWRSWSRRRKTRPTWRATGTSSLLERLVPRQLTWRRVNTPRESATEALQKAIALNRTLVDYRIAAARWYNLIEQPEQAFEVGPPLPLLLLRPAIITPPDFAYLTVSCVVSCVPCVVCCASPGIVDRLRHGTQRPERLLRPFGLAAVIVHVGPDLRSDGAHLSFFVHMLIRNFIYLLYTY
jgi:hypothetical protein